MEKALGSCRLFGAWCRTFDWFNWKASESFRNTVSLLLRILDISVPASTGERVPKTVTNRIRWVGQQEQIGGWDKFKTQRYLVEWTYRFSLTCWTRIDKEIIVKQLSKFRRMKNKRIDSLRILVTIYWWNKSETVQPLEKSDNIRVLPLISKVLRLIINQESIISVFG